MSLYIFKLLLCFPLSLLKTITFQNSLHSTKPMPPFSFTSYYYYYYYYYFFGFILFSSLSTPLVFASPTNDTKALLQFRSQVDAHGTLAANWTSNDACATRWHGVVCSPKGGVIGLSLPSLDLRGPIDALATLRKLRFIDLHDNRLNGSLHLLSNCISLKLLYLSKNDFSGPIPSQFSLLRRILRLDLSDNNLSGPIPPGLSNLTGLMTLRLQNNALSGTVPDLSSALTGLHEFNVSNNELRGRVPDGLETKFGPSSFVGNSGLCGSGPELLACLFLDSAVPSPSDLVPSNPSQMPGHAMPVAGGAGKRKGLSPSAIVGIVVVDAVVVLVIASFLLAYYCRGSSSRGDSDDGDDEEKRKSNGSGDVYGKSSEEMNKLVFYERRKGKFELEDLLKASAEMVGKGSLGTVYRAVMEEGLTVAVKRLKDASPCGRKEFEEYMDAIGKMRHPNILRLTAYYYAKEEKLLIYDYLPNGSLYSLLHANRGPGRTPLDWTTRIGIVVGVARGLARIHQDANVPHGNVKSSNVLLDKNGTSCIADFGLSLLLNPAHAVARLGGYRAPEQLESKSLSRPADVYAFGILLMEVLTGKPPAQYPARPPHEQPNEPPVDDLPKWVRSTIREEWTAEIFDSELLRYKNIEEELVAMLHVALACVVAQPEERPGMAQVVKLIEDIRVEQSPIGEDMDESRNSPSPSMATTEDARVSY